jgi:hypothetical protein
MPQKTRRSAKTPALDELLALLPELDDAGVSFLLEQAKVHRYNMEVQRLNDIAARSDSIGPRPVPVPALRIERSEDGSTYHLVAGSDWKMLAAEEMAALVRISRSGDGEEEIARRLKAWLARERKDIYLDLGLDGQSGRMARDIARLLAATFPPRAAKRA